MPETFRSTRDGNFNLEARLDALRARTEQALSRYLPCADTTPQRLHQAMRYATLNGGKRVRACLVYASGQAVGAPLDVLDAPAAAVELVHSYSLVHDDLPSMDNDELRRGKPTCHKAYGEATALLAGDALQSRAFEILARETNPALGANQRIAMVRTLAQAIGSSGMAGGQAIDLESVGKSLDPSVLRDMHQRKTGALIHAAVMLGSQACDSLDSTLVNALDRYGAAIGLAFQIADDILDVEGDADRLGKNPGVDQARSKPTYPSVLGLDGARNKAHSLCVTALESLMPLGDNAMLLAGLARYIIERRH
jgi:farnesyl diphosphate synthase